MDFFLWYLQLDPKFPSTSPCLLPLRSAHFEGTIHPLLPVSLHLICMRDRKGFLLLLIMGRNDRPIRWQVVHPPSYFSPPDLLLQFSGYDFISCLSLDNHGIIMASIDISKVLICENDGWLAFGGLFLHFY